jgi:hypothetical protein
VPEILGLITIFSILSGTFVALFGRAGLKDLEKTHQGTKVELTNICSSLKTDLSTLINDLEIKLAVLNQSHSDSKERTREALEEFKLQLYRIQSRIDGLNRSLIDFTEKT